MQISYYALVPFSDAISVDVPTTSISIGSTPLLDQEHDQRRGGPKRTQSVNISRATVERFAREKLREALVAKLGYNNFGAFTSEETVGQNISTRA